MKAAGNLTRSTKDAFWDVVLDCLTDLFQVPPSLASLWCKDRRADVEFAPRDVKSNIFYHREPFDVAGDLAKRQPPISGSTTPSRDDPSIEARYLQIIARHGVGP
jgi:hypothetical protein